MKKLLKTILIIPIFFWFVSSQYYYFSQSWKYQQWCDETLTVMVNPQWSWVRWWWIRLDLPQGASYYTWITPASLANNLFLATSATSIFSSWPIDTNTHQAKSPSWKTEFSVLQVERYNPDNSSVTQVKKFWDLKFIPKFSNTNEYTLDFSFIYNWDWLRTYLNESWFINSLKQNQNLTETITVFQAPCTSDGTAPVIEAKQWNNSLNLKSKIKKNNWITFYLTDNVWVSTLSDVPYVFNWSNTWTDNTESISNQYWVDTGTINLTISCADCNIPWTKTITWWTIAWYPYSKTWQNKALNYSWTIPGSQLWNFEVEKTIRIQWSVQDRARVSWLSDSRRQWSIDISFNEPQQPNVQFESPKNGSKNQNFDVDIKVKLDDDWAWVNESTIKIILSWAYASWTSVSQRTFQWNQLVKTPIVSLSWANTSWYMVVLSWSVYGQVKPLPEDSNIQVIVEFSDNAWTSIRNNNKIIFRTHAPCWELECCNWTEVYITTWWDYELANITWTNLTVSWNAELVEWEDWTWTIICQTSGLSMYFGDENSVPTTQNFLAFMDWNNIEVDIPWVKWVLSGNVLTLKYYIDDAELILLQPYSWQEYRSNNNVDFQWQLSGWVWSETTRYSLYVVSSDTQPSDWWDPIYVTNDLTARVWLDNANSYRWRIVAEDWNQIEAFTWTFLVDVNSIATTTVITPINLSWTIASRTSTWLYLLDDMVLEWSVDVGQWSWDLTKFEYEVYQWNQCLWTPFATWAVDIQSQWVIPTTWQIYRLLEEWEYCWQVRVLDTNNNTSPSWTGKTFVVSNPYCAKTDSKLTLLSPENNAQLYNSDVTLRWSWNWDDCIAGQSWYHVELYSGTVWDTTDMITSWNYDSLTELLSISLSGGQYRWRVKMLSSDVEWEWKNSSFEIVSMMDPNNLINFELVLDEPVSWQNPVDRNVSFRWHVNWTWVWTLMYDINIYTWVINDTENSTLIANWVDLITTWFDRLLPNWDDYRWKVTVRDNYGNPSITEFTWSFDLNVSKNVRGVEITQISPVWSVAPWDILFEWNWNIPTDWEWVVNHYEVRVHEWDCAWDIIYTGNNLSIETTWFTTQIMEWGNYCWEIWAVDTDGYTWWRVETGFILSSELIIKVNLWWWDGNNKSRWKFFLYESWNKDAPKYSGYVNIWTDWTWSFNEIVEPWYYDVVFKDWQYLSVYQTWQYIDWSSKIIDFTNTWITMWLDESGYLWYWDFPNLSNWQWTYSFNINGVDFWFVYGIYCMSWEVTWISDRFHRICDLNHDGRVTVDDWAWILKYLAEQPADLVFKEQDKGLYKGFGLLDYWIVNWLRTDDEKWSNYVSLYDNR